MCVECLPSSYHSLPFEKKIKNRGWEKPRVYYNQNKDKTNSVLLKNTDMGTGEMACQSVKRVLGQQEDMILDARQPNKSPVLSCQSLTLKKESGRQTGVSQSSLVSQSSQTRSGFSERLGLER